MGWESYQALPCTERFQSTCGIAGITDPFSLFIASVIALELGSIGKAVGAQFTPEACRVESTEEYVHSYPGEPIESSTTEFISCWTYKTKVWPGFAVVAMNELALLFTNQHAKRVLLLDHLAIS